MIGMYGANNSNMYAVRPDGTMKWLFEAERELAGIWTTRAGIVQVIG